MIGTKDLNQNNIHGPRSRRYPGSSSFGNTAIDRLRFKGREEEKTILLQKVLANKLIVIFAPSGAGKTSLINAGLYQELIDRKYYPIKLRFEQDKMKLIDQFYNQIWDESSRGKVQIRSNYPEFFNKKFQELKLLPWVYFKFNEFWSDDYMKRTPVLIFDQFEDIFMRYKKSDRTDFLERLGDVATERVPDSIKEKEVLTSNFDQIFNYDDTIVNVKILISIREDFLGYLYELSEDIPAILHNCIRISQLDDKAARSAIIEPAKISNDAFIAPPFSYEEKSLVSIFNYFDLQFTSQDKISKNRIEPFHLQIICERCEDIIQEKFKNGRSENLSITNDDLGGVKGIKKFFKNYYHKQFAGLKFSQKRRFLKLFEKGLISKSGTRNNLGEKNIADDYNIKGAELTKLRQNRLIHRFSRGKDTYYELSHDNLIPIVLEEKNKRRHTSMLILSIILVVLIAIPTGYIYSKIETERKGKAEINKLLSEAYILSINEEYQNALDKYLLILEIDVENIPALKGAADNNYFFKKYDKAVFYYDAIINGSDVREDKSMAYIGKAKSYSKLGDLINEIQSYEALISNVDKNNYTANSELARIYFNKEEYDFAKKYYLILKGISPDIEPCLRLAEIHKIKGNINKAISNAQEAVKRASAEPVEFNKTDVLLPIQIFERVFSLNKVGDKMIALELYDIALNAYQKSVAEAEKNIQKHLPDLKHALNRIGLIHNENKNHSDAIIAYQKVREYEQDNIVAHQGLGHAYTLAGDFKKAISHYQKALEKDQNNFDVNKELAHCYTLKENPEYKKAISHYLHVINIAKEILQSNREKEKKDKARQELPVLLVGLAGVYLKQGHFDLSKSQHVQAIGISVATSETHLLSIHLDSAYNGLIDCLHRQEKLNQAQIIYELAIATNPDNFNAHLKMANINLRNDNYEEAVAIYRKIINKYPDNLDAHEGLGSAYSRMERFNEAKNHYQILLKISQHQKKLQHKYVAYLGLGFVYYKNGEYDKSEENYSRVLQYDPKKAYALSGLGSVYEMKRDFKNARKFYEQALNLIPQLKPAREGLERLQNSTN